MFTEFSHNWLSSQNRQGQKQMILCVNIMCEPSGPAGFKQINSESEDKQIPTPISPLKSE